MIFDENPETYSPNTFATATSSLLNQPLVSVAATESL